MRNFVKILLLGSFFASILMSANAVAQAVQVERTTVQRHDVDEPVVKVKKQTVRRDVDVDSAVVKVKKHHRNHDRDVVIVKKKKPYIRYHSREWYRIYGDRDYHDRYNYGRSYRPSRDSDRVYIIRGDRHRDWNRHDRDRNGRDWDRHDRDDN